MLMPYMPQNEIAMMDAVFALKRPARVLEFGAGGSTVRWSALPFVKWWLSTEHNQDWALSVRAGCGTNVDVVKVQEDEYLQRFKYVLSCFVLSGYPSTFDLIFVDGLYRVECIKASPQWLAPNGVVVLHDAIRTEYAEAWDVYPHKATLTRGECVRRQLSIEHDGCRNGLMLMWGDA